MTIRRLIIDSTFDWKAHALCATPRFRILPWFSDEREEMSWDRKRRVKDMMNKVCSACPVLAECHDYAESHHVTAGIWAGKDYGRSMREAG